MSTELPNVILSPIKTDLAPVPTSRSDEKTLESEDTICGIGNFHPSWLQNLNSPRLFLVNHSILGVLQGAFFTYMIGCLSTLEKRYAFETKVTGVIMISDEISPILFGMLLGYFGGKSHRPRLVAFGMAVAVFSCFLMAMPYFIYGSIKDFSSASVRHVTNRTKYEFCDQKEKDYFCEKSPTFTAVSIFTFAGFLNGFGSLAFYTIGTSHLDDSVKKKNSPLYFGTLFALRILGPTGGFLLSSLCLNFYEDPFYDPGYGTNDPRWIGAWWLGFILLGSLLFVFSLPMALFPKQFPSKRLPAAHAKKEAEPYKKPIEQLKDMWISMKRLSKNPILVCHYLGGVLRINALMGYYMLLPKYMEMQFRQSASKASLYSGPVSLVGMLLGVLSGGIILRKFKPRPRFMTGGIVVAEFVCLFTLLVCMTISCPVHQMTGTSSVMQPGFNLQNECNSDCFCTTKVYTPVCGPDGQSTYFSPCHAGCSGYNKTGKKEVFKNCKCVYNAAMEVMEGDADKGYCNFECQSLIAFVVVLSIGKLVSSTTKVANALVTLRCVDKEDKSLALGVLSGVLSLFAMIPSPLIYGALTDASCLVWEESCGKTGNCWIYDTDKLNYLLHGVSATFLFLGCLTDVAVCILSPRLKNLYDDDLEGDVIHNSGMLGGIKTDVLNGSVHSLNEGEKCVACEK